jgi:hypothetical protein
MTGRAAKGALGIAVVGGAAAFVLAGSGIAMASPLPGQATPGAIGATTGWNRIVNQLSTSGAGEGKYGIGSEPPSSTSGAGEGKAGIGSAPTAPTGTGWSRVNNQPGNGSAPASTPVSTGTGWNRVNNQPGNGSAPTSVPTPSVPAPISWNVTQTSPGGGSSPSVPAPISWNVTQTSTR